MNPHKELIDDGMGRLVKNQRYLDYEQGAKEEGERRDKEECEFLDRILHMPFFEFCLLVKERKQALREEGDGS